MLSSLLYLEKVGVTTMTTVPTKKRQRRARLPDVGVFYSVSPRYGRLAHGVRACILLG